jgi:hypothetical protein
MKIFVQARKDGYNTLYPKPTPNEFRQFASDIIRIQNEPENILGKCVYSIAFGNDGYIFTQHLIVEDIQRGGLGNVGFSIHIPKNSKLSGDNIKNLLDELIKAYSQNFCPDFYLGNVQEDWILFSSLANSYDSKLVAVSSEDNETKQSGNLDAAFIYYISDVELQKYFEQPLKEEYIPYRQIFFISNEFKVKANPENPLYVLKNSGVDLTGKIDLENPSYKLREFHGNAKNGVSIIIKNSKGKQLYNKDEIFRKDELTVVYSKKNYKEKRITGSLLNNEEIRNFLNVSNDNKIDVLKEVELESEVKTISFEVVKNNSRVLDAIITCKCNYQQDKIVSNNQVDFSGEDLNERWSASAKIGDNFFSNSHTIDFEKDSLSPIKLTLNERRKVKIIAIQEEEPKEPIYNFKVWVRGKVDTEIVNEIVFEGDEINKTYDITVEKEGYKRTDTLQYCPALDKNPIYFKLKKENTVSGMTQKIQSKTDLDKDKAKKADEEKKTKKPKFIIFSILSVLILSIGIWGLSHYFGKQKNPNEKITAEQINEYLEGDALILSKLNAYKANWDKQNPRNSTKDEGFLSSLLSDNKNPNSSEETYNWNQIGDSINSAITKRKLIDKMDFEKLEKVHFSNQESFEKTIDDVNKSKYELLKKKLGDVSNLSLTEIESKIKGIINGQESKENGADLPVNQEQRAPVSATVSSKNPGATTNGTSDEKKPAKADGNTVSSITGDTSEIIARLKSGELTKSKLDDYKSKKIEAKLLKSVELALNLWGLDPDNKPQCKKYLNDITQNDNLKQNTVLKNIVNEIISKGKSIKQISNNSKLTLNQLSSELKKK